VAEMKSQLIPADNGSVRITHGLPVLSVDKIVKLVNSEQLNQMFTPPNSILNLIAQNSALIS